MAMQAPSSSTAIRRVVPSPLSAPSAHVGLRAPADRFALRSAFFSPSVQLLLPPRIAAGAAPATAPKFSMRVASKQAYICRDCGFNSLPPTSPFIYIYNDRTPFEKVSDNYFCPVCGAPKRRFRAYQPTVTKDANDTNVRKARKAQIKKDEAIGNALPVAIVAGIAALAGLYFYLNNAY